jgi:hypothetical protein
MTKKIKSIKLNEGCDLAFHADKTINQIIEDFPNVFQIEYESEKPKLLKRADGSLISGLEEGQEIIFINPVDHEIEEGKYSKEAKIILQQGLIFLPEDKNLADKKSAMHTKQLEIKNEIDRLNAEKDWVANWSIVSSKYYLFDCPRERKIIWDGTTSNRGVQHMSKTTAETILAKYSQDELKQYLGIII